jgi:hypothetical protein
VTHRGRGGTSGTPAAVPDGVMLLALVILAIFVLVAFECSEIR